MQNKMVQYIQNNYQKWWTVLLHRLKNRYVNSKWDKRHNLLVFEFTATCRETLLPHVTRINDDSLDMPRHKPLLCLMNIPSSETKNVASFERQLKSTFSKFILLSTSLPKTINDTKLMGKTKSNILTYFLFWKIASKKQKWS